MLGNHSTFLTNYSEHFTFLKTTVLKHGEKHLTFDPDIDPDSELINYSEHLTFLKTTVLKHGEKLVIILKKTIGIKHGKTVEK